MIGCLYHLDMQGGSSSHIAYEYPMVQGLVSGPQWIGDAHHGQVLVRIVTEYESRQRVKTSVKKNSCNPIWNEELTLALKDPDIPIVLSVYDKDTFTGDDKMGVARIDIKPYLEILKMGLQGLPNGVKVDRVQPSKDNCLACESCIIWENGKMTQDMILRLQDAECGEVEVQIELIPKCIPK
ncbi:putative MLP-like protein 34-like [Capsicum annuum]|nr:putative MLP-like protein 34-like [Capsicum annuum]KAF3650369.1 putative MLP-like protein 34-like [Capsicum annuum]